jgi:hypothetical protein
MYVIKDQLDPFEKNCQNYTDFLVKKFKSGSRCNYFGSGSDLKKMSNPTGSGSTTLLVTSPCFSLDLHSGVGHILLLILCFLHVVERAALEEPVAEAGRPGRQGPRNRGERGGAKQTHHAGRVCGIRHRSVVLVFRSSKISQGYGNFFSEIHI